MLRVNGEFSVYRLSYLVDPEYLSIVGVVRLCQNEPIGFDLFRVDSACGINEG